MGRPRTKPPKPPRDPNAPRNKGGRPRIPLVFDPPDNLPKREIRWDQVAYWMDIGATEAEIAGSFHIGQKAFNEKLKEHFGIGFAELRERTCGPAKIKLRQNQFKMSENNASMAIWLGKQWLGQAEPDTRPEIFMSEKLVDRLMDKDNPFGIEVKQPAAPQLTDQSSLALAKPVLDQGQAGEKGQV